jgi:hypothetical protein
MKNSQVVFESISYQHVHDLYEKKQGLVFFIPDGFEPALLPKDEESDTVNNLLKCCTKLNNALNVSRTLPTSDVRLPTIVLRSGVSKREVPKIKNKKKKIPRPANSFILYRRHYQSQIQKNNPGISNNEVSKTLGEMWKTASPQERARFASMAQQAKYAHQEMYPDYKYRPRKSRVRRSTRRSSDNLTENQISKPAEIRESNVNNSIEDCNARIPQTSESSNQLNEPDIGSETMAMLGYFPNEAFFVEPYIGDLFPESLNYSYIPNTYIPITYIPNSYTPNTQPLACNLYEHSATDEGFQMI